MPESTRTRTRSRGWRAGDLLEPVCAAVVLQLVAVACAVPVVTALPAVIAVRIGLRDIRDGDVTVSPRRVLGDTVQAFRRLWPLSVGVVPLALGWALALLFWVSRPAPYGWVAAGLLCALGGTASTVLLGGISTARRDRADADPTDKDERRGASRRWLRAGLDAMLMKPLRAAACVVLLASWLLLVLRLPTVLLLGGAIVPALLATWLGGRPRRGR